MRFVAAVAFAMACTSPGTPTIEQGTPASADLLGVSMHGVRVYAVRDAKRNVTCWLPVTPTGNTGGIHCEPDVAPPQPARTDTSTSPVALPPVPPMPR